MPTFLLSTTKTSKQIKRMVAAGRLRHIGGALHTSDTVTPLEQLCRMRRWEIVSLLCPGAVLCQRTGFDRNAAPDDSVFVSDTYPDIVKVPGLVIRRVKTAGPLEGDLPFINGLYLPSEARIALENLPASRSRGLIARTVGRKAVEEFLVKILRRGGERELNALRDAARRIAPALGAEKEMNVLEKIVGALLTTHESKLVSAQARAVAAGHPYDPIRVARLDVLANALRHADFELRSNRSVNQAAFANEAFFDAYFSNYIEGTKFPVEQAIDIVFRGAIPDQRPADAHDIIGTFLVVGNPAEMRRELRTYDEFETALRRRHAQIMERRVDRSPGLFKSRDNEAGGTLFVPPDLVVGTLRKGWEFMPSLTHPMARALFVMFLVSEVHPFVDGNGRTARTMMNGELVRADHTRIMIPSVFRNEYLGGLRLLSNHDDPSAYLRVMDYAQRFVSRISFDELEGARETLRQCWAFQDPSETIKLRMPAEDGAIDDKPVPADPGRWSDILPSALEEP